MYKLSQHAKERYAQRIMDREEKMDAKIFAANHDSMIVEDVNKMIEFGTVIYEGRGIQDYNKKNGVRYVINGLWLVVIDPAENKVITLYKIDLGAGDDFNKQYLNLMLGKLSAAVDHVGESTQTIKELESVYTQQIEDNKTKIQDMKARINSLMKQNEYLEGLLTEQKDNYKIAEDEIIDVLTTIVLGRDM